MTDPNLEAAVAQAEADGAELAAELGTAPRPADKAPKRGPGRPRGSSSKPTQPRANTNIAALERRLTTQLIEAGAMLTLVDEYDGTVIMAQAERLAKAWCRVAEENKSVRRFLEGSLEGSAWLGAVAATLSVAVPICAHHGLLPMPAMFAAASGVPSSNGDAGDE